jgi:hypothetical protein
MQSLKAHEDRLIMLFNFQPDGGNRTTFEIRNEV